jgi:hypothetical protein
MDEVSEYHLKRATVSGGPYDQITIGPALPLYTDFGLQAGTHYYYVVSMMSDGVESSDSAEVVAVPSAEINPADVVMDSIGIIENGSGGQNVSMSIAASGLGHNYQVKSAEDLINPDWQDASEVQPGNGGELIFDLPVGGTQTNLFYKLEAWRQ